MPSASICTHIRTHTTPGKLTSQSGLGALPSNPAVTLPQVLFKCTGNGFDFPFTFLVCKVNCLCLLPFNTL